MVPSNMHGARVQLVGIWKGQTRTLGIFNSVSFGFTIDVAEVNLLGRFSAAELVNTGVETVNVTCNGYRVINHGPHADGMVPLISELLSAEYVELILRDRQTNTVVGRLSNARPTGYSTGANARSLQELSVSFRAIYVEDESGPNAELPSATQLP